jgi:hypothetical protein
MQAFGALREWRLRQSERLDRVYLDSVVTGRALENHWQVATGQQLDPRVGGRRGRRAGNHRPDSGRAPARIGDSGRSPGGLTWTGSPAAAAAGRIRRSAPSCSVPTIFPRCPDPSFLRCTKPGARVDKFREASARPSEAAGGARPFPGDGPQLDGTCAGGGLRAGPESGPYPPRTFKESSPPRFRRRRRSRGKLCASHARPRAAPPPARRRPSGQWPTPVGTRRRQPQGGRPRPAAGRVRAIRAVPLSEAMI